MFSFFVSCFRSLVDIFRHLNANTVFRFEFGLNLDDIQVIEAIGCTDKLEVVGRQGA